MRSIVTHAGRPQHTPTPQQTIASALPAAELLTPTVLTPASFPPPLQDLPEALLAVATWLRFSAARQLVWNRNYNIKPREISQAQNKLGDRLAHIWMTRWVKLPTPLVTSPLPPPDS